MTKWIERYRREAEERYRRLDAVLAEMNERPTPTHDHQTTERRKEPHHDHHSPRPPSRPTPRCRSSGSPATSPPPRRSCCGRTPTPSCSPRGSGRTPVRPRSTTGTRATGGSWRYVAHRDGEEYGFRGSFHEVRPDRIVQTFTWEGDARRRGAGDAVGSRTSATAAPGCTRSRWSTASRAGTRGWRSGMEVGVNEGYAKLDAAAGRWHCLTGPAEQHRAGRRRVHRAGRGGDPATGTRRRRCAGLARAGRRRATWPSGSRRSSPPARAYTRRPGRPSTTTRSAAWQARRRGAGAARRPGDRRPVLTNPHIGEVPLDRAIDQFYTADVFMHTWDLARATGQDDRLDADLCAAAAGRAWSRWTSCCARPASTGRRCRCPPTPTSRPG